MQLVQFPQCGKPIKRHNNETNFNHYDFDRHNDVHGRTINFVNIYTFYILNIYTDFNPFYKPSNKYINFNPHHWKTEYFACKQNS